MQILRNQAYKVRWLFAANDRGAGQIYKDYPGQADHYHDDIDRVVKASSCSKTTSSTTVHPHADELQYNLEHGGLLA